MTRFRCTGSTAAPVPAIKIVVPGRSCKVPENDRHHHHNNTMTIQGCSWCAWCAWYQALEPLFPLWRSWRSDPTSFSDCSLVRCGTIPPCLEWISHGKSAPVGPVAVYLLGYSRKPRGWRVSRQKQLSWFQYNVGNADRNGFLVHDRPVPVY